MLSSSLDNFLLVIWWCRVMALRDFQGARTPSKCKLFECKMCMGSSVLMTETAWKMLWWMSGSCKNLISINKRNSKKTQDFNFSLLFQTSILDYLEKFFLQIELTIWKFQWDICTLCLFLQVKCSLIVNPSSIEREEVHYHFTAWQRSDLLKLGRLCSGWSCKTGTKCNTPNNSHHRLIQPVGNHI